MQNVRLLKEKREIMQLSQNEFGEMAKKASPKSKLYVTLPKAFLFGGVICCIGQGFLNLYKMWLPEGSAAALTSVSLIFLSALLTGLGLYDKLAKHGGAGTLVPITGFANAVVSSALEFKTEGFVLGTAVKMFIIAGPVIVYGITASVVYGIILFFTGYMG